MEVKIPTVRRTDSLYAKLGGKDSLEAVVEELYRRVLADPELAPRFAGANAVSLKSQQVRYLASVLGGPAVYHGEAVAPMHEHLPSEDSAYARAAQHLAASLRALRVPKNLAEEVVALAAPLKAEIVNTFTNHAARPQQGEEGMATTEVMTDKLNRGLSRNRRNAGDEAQARANRTSDSVDRAEVYDLIPGLVLAMDTNHTVLDLNETAARTAGKPREECIGAKFWDLFDNPGCRAGTCAAAEAVRTGKVCEGETRPLVQGKEVPVLVTAAPRFDEAGRVIGVVELIFPAAGDIGLATEVSRLASAAREGQLDNRVDESKFQGRHLERAKTFNAMLDAVNVNFSSQLAAIKKSQAVIEFQMDGTVLDANDNCLKTLGYSLDEIKGKHHSMFVDEAYRRSADYKEFWAN